MSDIIAPLYKSAIFLPITAFPSWILCLPPLFWHFRQGNIAAGSLILWVCLINFFNSINPLIWPRDNLNEWWSGNVWCDIHVRIQVGAIVGTTASTALIVRKLARVMDTSNMIVSTNKNSRIKEHCLEVACCWGYPLVLIMVYYVVQPVRYLIYSIQGCLTAYDESWPSVVLSFMWAPITTLVAAGYAGILIYRLYTYRREFSRLLHARNTTKSRFIRLFLICLIVIAVYVPYTIWLLFDLVYKLHGRAAYSWSHVHDPKRFNTIMKIPSRGVVPIDKWGQVATGYVIFFVFGTGADAWKTYKSMMLAVGMGKLFSTLYKTEEFGNQTPTSIQTWRSRTKSVLWSRSGSIANSTTRSDTTHTDSIAMPKVRHADTAERVLAPQESRQSASTQSSFLSRIFTRSNVPHTVLPLFTHRSHFMSETKSTTPEARYPSPSVSAHAWATHTDISSNHYKITSDRVRVFRELRIGSQTDDEIVGKTSIDDLA